MRRQADEKKKSTARDRLVNMCMLHACDSDSKTTSVYGRERERG